MSKRYNRIRERIYGPKVDAATIQAALDKAVKNPRHSTYVFQPPSHTAEIARPDTPGYSHGRDDGEYEVFVQNLFASMYGGTETGRFRGPDPYVWPTLPVETGVDLARDEDETVVRYTVTEAASDYRVLEERLASNDTLHGAMSNLGRAASQLGRDLNNAVRDMTNSLRSLALDSLGMQEGGIVPSPRQTQQQSQDIDDTISIEDLRRTIETVRRASAASGVSFRDQYLGSFTPDNLDDVDFGEEPEEEMDGLNTEQSYLLLRALITRYRNSRPVGGTRAKIERRADRRTWNVSVGLEVPEEQIQDLLGGYAPNGLGSYELQIEAAMAMIENVRAQDAEDYHLLNLLMNTINKEPAVAEILRIRQPELMDVIDHRIQEGVRAPMPPTAQQRVSKFIDDETGRKLSTKRRRLNLRGAKPKPQGDGGEPQN